MRVIVKSPLRRRALSSALVRLFAPKGGGIGRMFVSRAAWLASIFKSSRQFASSRVGFVLIMLITLRLGRTHTRLNCLRATNSSLPVVVLLSPLFLFLSCLCLFLSRVSRWARPARRGMFLFGFLFSSFFSLCLLPTASLCARRGPCLPLFLSAVKLLAGRSSLSLFCVCLVPRVSRPTVTLSSR